MNHDCTHCNGDNCPKKDTCHRYKVFRALRGDEEYPISFCSAAECVENDYSLHWEDENVDAQSEREMYRIKCKHYLPENEQCCLKSGWHGSVHLLIGCDGDCRRMKNYDKKHANNG